MKSWELANDYKIFKIASQRSNAYLVATEKGNILIDTSHKEFRQHYKSKILDCKLSNENIEYLILTHTHYDHCFNASLFKDQEKLKILAGEKELNFIEKGHTPLPSGTGTFSRVLVFIGRHINNKPFSYESFKVDIPVDIDLDMRKMGYEIEIIPTPGHSAGSISIIVNNELAFVGDTLFGIFKNSVLPPFADDISEMIRSWKKLLDTGCHTFLPGHGKEIKRPLLEKEYLKYAKKFNLKTHLNPGNISL